MCRAFFFSVLLFSSSALAQGVCNEQAALEAVKPVMVDYCAAHGCVFKALPDDKGRLFHWRVEVLKVNRLNPDGTPDLRAPIVAHVGGDNIHSTEYLPCFPQPQPRESYDRR